MDDSTPASSSSSSSSSSSTSSHSYPPSSTFTNIQDFRVLAKLGLGAYGSVYQVVRKADNHTYAMKRVNLDGLDRRDLAMALNEIRLLASFRHPRIIRCYETFMDGPTHLCIVMEYCGFQDLARKIQRYRTRGERVDERVVWVYLVQCLEALSALHALRVLHRDIKPANILLDEDGNAKLGDLNVSKCLDDETGEVQSVLGTLPYMAPEIWEGKPYGFAADLYSLGCTLFELTTLVQPFDGPTPLHLRRAVLKRQFQARLDTDDFYSQELRDLILLRLLHPDPAQRLTADTLMQVPEVASRLDLVRHKLPEVLPASLPLTPSALLLHHLNSNGGISNSSSSCSNSSEKGGKEQEKEEVDTGVETPTTSNSSSNSSSSNDNNNNSLSLTLEELPSLLPSLLPGPSYPDPSPPPPPPLPPPPSPSVTLNVNKSNSRSNNSADTPSDATFLPSPFPPSLSLSGPGVTRKDSLTALLRSPFASASSGTISRTIASETTAPVKRGGCVVATQQQQCEEEGRTLAHSFPSTVASSPCSSSSLEAPIKSPPSTATTMTTTTDRAAATTAACKAKHGGKRPRKKRPDSLSTASMTTTSTSSALASTTTLVHSLSLTQTLEDVGKEGEEGGRGNSREKLNSEGQVQWEALPTPNSFPLPLLSPCPASPPFEQQLVVRREGTGIEGGTVEEGGREGEQIGREEREWLEGCFTD